MITIAIDGLVATGKGTTAKGVAKALGYTYLDTGAMYRAVTLYAIRHGLIDTSDDQKVSMMDQIDLSYQYNQETDHDDIYLNGENVERLIRESSLALQLPKIVTIPGIRKNLVKRQQAYGKKGGIVGDGRDMGTVVFSDAELKLFLICDTETRVQRRYDQLIAQSLAADKDIIRQEIELRDATDYLGPDAVNQRAADALVIDTSTQTIEGQIDLIVGLARAHIKRLEQIRQ